MFPTNPTASVPRRTYTRTRTLTVTLAALSLLGAAVGQADQIDDELGKNPAYRAGILALSQNKNEVASIRLREVAATGLAPAAKIRVLCRIAEAEVHKKDFAAAMELFAEPGLATDPQASFWHALALIGSSRNDDAEKVLATITAQPDHPYWAEATLTRTSLLLRIGADDEAIELLAPLIASGQPEQAARARMRAAEIRLNQKQWDEVAKLLEGFESPGTGIDPQLQYLKARLSIGLGDWPNALTLLKSLISPQTLTGLKPDLRDAIIIALAEALRHTGDAPAASTHLHQLIDNHPESPNLIAAFDVLESLGTFATPTIDEKLAKWINSPTLNLAVTATYFLAIAQISAVNEDAAATTLEAIRSSFADHPIAERALLQLSEIYVADANKQEALSVLADLRKLSKSPAVLARIAFIDARAEFAAGEFKLAADKFALAATADKADTAIATFNSAIAAMKADDADTLNLRSQALEGLGAPELSADLELERALFEARPPQRHPDAAKALSQFLSDHPQHPRRAEALLALAYLQLNQNQPMIVPARANLALAREAPLTPALVEEADYTAFWIETQDYSKPDGNTPAAVAAAELFIKQHPGSARAPEILFKLAGIHFRDGAFTDAQTRFERLALDYPTAARAELAMFTAGRAAMRTGTTSSLERAINIFRSVAEGGGEFATAARLQEALVQRTIGEESEAIKVLEAILKNDRPEGELLYSTMITKGESFLVVRRDDDAIAVFDEITRLDGIGASPYWLNQALTRKGNALERVGKTDEALAAYEQVISPQVPAAGSNGIPEYVWFYKAGFAAIRIYEERKNWEAAISTADILAATNGPGAQAARQRAQQLETKNFIWPEVLKGEAASPRRQPQPPGS